MLSLLGNQDLPEPIKPHQNALRSRGLHRDVGWSQLRKIRHPENRSRAFFGVSQRSGVGRLKTVTAVKPVNRCPQTVVRSAEVKRFEKKYVALFALAKEQGRHFRKVKLELDAKGAKPVFDVNKIGATYYVRSGCQHDCCNQSLTEARRSESPATQTILPTQRACHRADGDA
ncbi:hypothetical protein V1282_004343 [Nitrobacteraceae bacterium AZCC 2146]